ncbi:penicillin-binding protein 1C [Campylobacter sp. RM9328]|uniref:penicillin-binding protein 1C n=1 Tax=Campylobacter sp. RM9328 TaxID=1705720 RepID=UPI001472BD48|nr:penicillin-binding protein 1C [Campylobacter sp. RM9328]
MNKTLPRSLKFLKFTVSFFAILLVAFMLFDALFPLNLDKLNKDDSKVVYDKNGEILRMKLASDGAWRFHTHEVPEILKKSVLLFEDKFYYYHFGVNPLSIIRASFYNITHKNRIGASTITMQVARMLEANERTYANKIKEIFRAFQLEWHFSKDEILNLYFNLAPYGGNIEGIKAAARFYFNKNLSQLSYAQIALLTTIPKNPNKNRLDKKSDINTLKNRVAKLLFDAGIIDLSALKRAQNEPFVNTRLNAPFHAPSYTDVAFKNGITNSNLNLEFQNDLLNILNQTMFKLKQNGANNASAVLIDNKKMSVVAFIGSHDQSSKDGKNSSLNMKRNVGSTLKPFIYSLALDSGLITPKSELIDTQIYINEYVPRNFNDDFLGKVSAKDALGLSLNIPAVNLNQKLGDNSLYELLEKINLIDNKKEFYGASIALGSPEISLLNLTRLYTIYANGGKLLPLEFAGEFVNNQNEILNLISPQSAYLSAKMMSEASRGILKNAWQYAQNTPTIAFKTGTSYNSRDLYALGVDQNYTLGIWIGNFNGEKTSRLTGLNDASSVVFDMFKLLSQKEKLNFMQKPDGIVLAPTCLDSFEFKECKNMQQDEQILGVWPQNKCQNLRSEELDFMYKNGFLNKNDIAQSPCAKFLRDKAPIFASLYDGQIFINDNNQTKVMIKCYAYLGDEIYITLGNGEFIKRQSASENIVSLATGQHRIGCLDENSNYKEIKIEIRR